MIINESNPVGEELMENVHDIDTLVIMPDMAVHAFEPEFNIDDGVEAPKDAKFHFGKLTSIIPPTGILFLGVTFKTQLAVAPTIGSLLAIVAAVKISGVYIAVKAVVEESRRVLELE